MSEEYRHIGIGDVVNVHFSDGESLLRATVAGTPQATGDCWKLVLDGRRYNVQQYEIMSDVVKEK